MTPDPSQSESTSESPAEPRIRSANCIAGDHNECARMVEQDDPELGITDCLCNCHTDEAAGSEELSTPIVMRVHYGDSEAYYRAYNEGFDDGARDALLGIPDGLYEGANRYDTDDQHVLHVWADGQSFDLTAPKAGEARAASVPPATPDVVEALPIAAIHSSIKWVEETIAPRRCDNEAVADCSRCNLVFLARMMTKALAALPAQREPAPELDVEGLTKVLWNSVDEARAWLDGEATSHNFASHLAAAYRDAKREPVPADEAER